MQAHPSSYLAIATSTRAQTVRWSPVYAVYAGGVIIVVHLWQSVNQYHGNNMFAYGRSIITSNSPRSKCRVEVYVAQVK